MSTQTPSTPPAPAPAKPDKAEKKSYKDSLNLPQTGFPMEAKLVQNEPKRLAEWEEVRLYEKLLTARAAGPRWVLHDGPPFANGDIHIGHLINKTLKDVILRFRTMQGFQTPYVPGWDCHGLPIEHKIQEDLRKKHGKKFREMGALEVRKECFVYAQRYADVQGEQFRRLGILGDWTNPYLTMKPEYEAGTLEVFAKFVEAGLVYKQLKPVHWSIANQTALADAELEYQDVTDASVYVEFPVNTVKSPNGDSVTPAHKNLHLLIWTTTPWTLPANLAIAVNPDAEYAFVDYVRAGNERVGIVASALVDAVFKGHKGVTRYTVIDLKSSELVGAEYDHPFVRRTGKVVAADYVTVDVPADKTEKEGGAPEEPGTGLVHTAPGHGEEDYQTGIANGLEVYNPVLANGRFDESVPDWLRGMLVWDANPVIIKKLHDLGVLFAEKPITHSYPHDWRSKTPTIFRATEQWFVALDKPFVVNAPLCPLPGHHRGETEKQADETPVSLRRRALAAVEEKIEFVPGWGRQRILGMLQSRPDWCVSRQRSWGLPIPVFYNEKGDALLTPESVRAVGRHFKQHGSDAWFTCDAAQLLGADFQYPPGFEPGKLRKESDIFDVWFESGSSWHSVLQERSYLHFPADLYLEGSDQHRGWFQLSLLPSLGATGKPPFKQVLTHGFAVKPDGKKLSKSDPDYVKAVDEINRHGADLLRLWCSSVDYQGDIATSQQMIKEFGDKYRKIRNTLRYLLSNLYDFDPRRDAQPVPPNSLDGWVSAELDQLIQDVTSGYDSYQLHRVFRLLHDFCAVQLSAIYGNAMKDRLYCEKPDSPLRRRCQTVMHRMVLALTKLLAPILVFTADEAWGHITHKPAEESTHPSVHLALLPAPSAPVAGEAQRMEWKMLMELRDQALAQLDKLTRQVGKYKVSDAEVVYHVADPALRRKLQAYGPDLEDLVGAGCWSFGDKAEGGGVSVEVLDRRDAYKACARSWKRRPDVGRDAGFPDLSLRDAGAVRAAVERRGADQPSDPIPPATPPAARPEAT